jgi:hypothetical protein
MPPGRSRRAGARLAAGGYASAGSWMLGLDPAAMPDLIGVTYRQAHQYEKGIGRVAIGPLCRIGRALDVSYPSAYCGRRRRPAGVCKVAAIVPLERGRAAACRRMTSPGVQTVACPKAFEAPQRDCSRPSRPKIASRPLPRSGPFRAPRECAGRRASDQSESAPAHRRRLGRRMPDSNNGDQQVLAGPRMQERTWTSST